MPHVLHVITRAQARGAEITAVQLAMGLTEIGWTNHVVALADGDHDTRLTGVDVLGRRERTPRTVCALRRRAREANIVVAHGSSTLYACVFGMRGLGIPIVYVTIGDLTYWAGDWSRRIRVRWLLRRAAAIGIITPSARRGLIDMFRVPAEKIAVVPNFRSSELFAPATAEHRAMLRMSFGLSTSAPLAAYIGALSPEKRVDLAIRAVADISDMCLVVAGAGRQRATLESLALRVAPGRVKFLGAIDHPEQLLAAADIALLTSDSEGVPGVLIEAGMCGVPTVATDVGWVSDVVVDGVTGILCRPGDPAAVARGIRDALLQREKLGAAARDRAAAMYDARVVVDQWAHLIDAVLAQSPDSARGTRL